MKSIWQQVLKQWELRYLRGISGYRLPFVKLETHESNYLFRCPLETLSWLAAHWQAPISTQSIWKDHNDPRWSYQNTTLNCIAFFFKFVYVYDYIYTYIN